uniref:Uncharacterized protein n=1 Tax=viral metagenome TaxID=1070528 RepID=A0A6C0CBU1_9ZZZZ
MDQYWHVRSPVDTNLYKSIDITLNGSILARSKSRQCKFIDITLNRQILARSKSCQCKLPQISRHHFEWTNICTFKVSSMQTSITLLTSL